MKINLKINNKGFTLVEVLVAMVILAIITVSFINAFSSGYIQIVSMGNKTSAMKHAQEIIDTIYNNGAAASASVVDYSDLHLFSGNSAQYGFSTVNVAGRLNNKVTVVVFYNGGQKHVTLSTIIP
ncbi:MAG: prepilin-type N-terminal cleavage/methylation domain-containing protein [Firmicutes bacterium]|nr:prepilin-type N-terminal cleavage/methylation domain-containing protein [Bacillota bacterium]